MKRLALMLATVLVALSSCKTTKKIVYFQDIERWEEAVPTQAVQILTFQPGEKLSIITSSARSPELAQQFNLPVVAQQAGSATRTSSNNQIALYTVDEKGDIDFPVIGKVHVQGLTRFQVAQKIQSTLRAGQLNDAVVTVESYDKYVTILGEVAKPGRVNITNDHLTILEALGLVGDLTIQARRDRILVLRQEGSMSKTYYVDIRSKDLLTSPVYNLQQNDVVVVEPNKVRAGQSTYNANNVRSIATWLSISSVLISVAILVFK